MKILYRMPLAHWHGNVYSRQIVADDDGRRILVTLARKHNDFISLASIAHRSVPRGWRPDHKRTAKTTSHPFLLNLEGSTYALPITKRLA